MISLIHDYADGHFSLLVLRDLFKKLFSIAVEKTVHSMYCCLYAIIGMAMALLG